MQTNTNSERPINPKDYGAVGDGKTDDTAAFNRAIKAALSTKIVGIGPVEVNDALEMTFNPGVYTFTEPVTFPLRCGLVISGLECRPLSNGG